MSKISMHPSGVGLVLAFLLFQTGLAAPPSGPWGTWTSPPNGVYFDHLVVQRTWPLSNINVPLGVQQYPQQVSSPVYNLSYEVKAHFAQPAAGMSPYRIFYVKAVSVPHPGNPEVPYFSTNLPATGTGPYSIAISQNAIALPVLSVKVIGHVQELIENTLMTTSIKEQVVADPMSPNAPFSKAEYEEAQVYGSIIPQEPGFILRAKFSFSAKADPVIGGNPYQGIAGTPAKKEAIFHQILVSGNPKPTREIIVLEEIEHSTGFFNREVRIESDFESTGTGPNQIRTRPQITCASMAYFRGRIS